MRLDPHSKRPRWHYGTGKGIYRVIDGEYPWTHVDRILRNYKGKNVDEAFSVYCSIVDTCQQFMFWRALSDHLPHGRTPHNSRYYGEGHYPYWYVDDNKNIQRYVPKKKKANYVIYSWDIKWGYKHIETGKVLEDKYNTYPYNKLVNMDKYIYTVIRGHKFEFAKKDKAYHRCYAEQLDKERKHRRKLDKQKRSKVYNFLTQEERDLIESRKVDILKRDAKGFDDESFTNKGGRLNDAGA